MSVSVSAHSAEPSKVRRATANGEKFRCAFVLASLFVGSAWAAEPAADRPFTSLPYTPSLDVTAMDRSVNPCEDLFTYACGGWQKKYPIPKDQASWSVYGKVYNENQRYLWGILEAVSKPDAKRTPSQQKIGDYFAACMDEAAVERAGRRPLQPYLDQIAGLQGKPQLGALLGSLHRHIQSGSLLFGFGVMQDAKDATQVIPAIFAGGLALPDRDYYVKDDAKSKQTRERFQAHVQRSFELLGDAPAAAKANAATVMRIETALARASLTAVDKRDPYRIYHRQALEVLAKSTPSFAWPAYFKALGTDGKPWLNVAEPAFVREVNALIERESLDSLKAYLRWGIVDAHASFLSKAFVDADFKFYSAYLRGVEQQPPRWKRCVTLVDRDLGEALGKEFVERNFPAAIKAQTLQMTQQVERAMKARIDQLDWMSPATKARAIEKLNKVTNKVGYPDAWRDYSSLAIARGDLFGNVTRAADFELARQRAKVGKPVDRSEWEMTAPTVNAYYNPQLNDINFPAAVLLPPLYDPKLDDAPNYGNTGGTIGHELTHAFDDEGRQYDGDGNLRDWWTKRDADEFERRAQCIRDQYSQYTIVDDIKINAKLTSGEDIADLGGLILAWIAWQEQTKAMRLKPVDGLTPDQRFFVGFAQWTCANERPENQRVNAVINPHSPPKYRINGVVANMPEFAAAFSCKAGQALYKKPENVCKVW